MFPQIIPCCPIRQVRTSLIIPVGCELCSHVPTSHLLLPEFPPQQDNFVPVLMRRECYLECKKCEEADFGADCETGIESFLSERPEQIKELGFYRSSRGTFVPIINQVTR